MIERVKKHFEPWHVKFIWACMIINLTLLYGILDPFVQILYYIGRDNGTFR